jgi:hypothetical protein
LGISIAQSYQCRPADIARAQANISSAWLSYGALVQLQTLATGTRTPPIVLRLAEVSMLFSSTETVRVDSGG